MDHVEHSYDELPEIMRHILSMTSWMLFLCLGDHIWHITPQFNIQVQITWGEIHPHTVLVTSNKEFIQFLWCSYMIITLLALGFRTLCVSACCYLSNAQSRISTVISPAWTNQRPMDSKFSVSRRLQGAPEWAHCDSML